MQDTKDNSTSAPDQDAQSTPSQDNHGPAKVQTTHEHSHSGTEEKVHEKKHSDKLPFYKSRKFLLTFFAVIFGLIAFVVLALIIAGLIIRSQKISGSGVIVNKDVVVGEFDRIELNVDSNLVVEQGPSSKLSVNTDDNIYNELEFKARGKTLVITRKTPLSLSKRLEPTQGINISLVVTEVQKITVNSSGAVELENLNQDKLEIVHNGAASLAGNLDLHELQMTINGAGDVAFAGQTAFFQLEVNGSGSCNCAGLETDESEIDISGSGDVEIHANSSLDIHISGSGDVTYSGEPDSITQKTTGSGSVSSLTR